MAATIVTALAFILFAVGAAELVRFQCRRMLAPPARRSAAAPARTVVPARTGAVATRSAAVVARPAVVRQPAGVLQPATAA